MMITVGARNGAGTGNSNSLGGDAFSFSFCFGGGGSSTCAPTLDCGTCFVRIGSSASGGYTLTSTCLCVVANGHYLVRLYWLMWLRWPRSWPMVAVLTGHFSAPLVLYSPTAGPTFCLMSFVAGVASLGGRQSRHLRLVVSVVVGAVCHLGQFTQKGLRHFIIFSNVRRVERGGCSGSGGCGSGGLVSLVLGSCLAPAA